MQDDWSVNLIDARHWLKVYADAMKAGNAVEAARASLELCKAGYECHKQAKAMALEQAKRLIR